MKKTIITLAHLLIVTLIFAQSPEKISYQAVIRDSDNKLVSNSKVGIQISILQDSADGTAVYTETQTPVTNANGLLSIEIGSGTVVSGNFADIDWAKGKYFVKTETDTKGGTDYSITGTSQLLSVPYALHAKTADALTSQGNDLENKFYLGQEIFGGIVCYIYLDKNGKQHGLIVSKNETTEKWQNSATTTNATRSWNGTYNTILMTGSPAKTWVASLGTDWYLPSIDELTILRQNRFHINKGLHKAGADLLSNSDNYWSSTENNKETANFLNFSTGKSGSESKVNSYKVRAVRTFSEVENPKEKRLNEILNTLNFPTSSDANISYSKNDNTVELNGSPSERAKKLVETIEPAKAIILGKNEVTTDQLEEIKKETDKIVKGAKTQEEKYRRIFRWLVKNIEYKNSDNSAYAVFKNRKGICQGFANLTKVMCYTQKIPAFIVGGYIIVNGRRYGGHAWNYVNTDGSWWVSDATNNRDYKLEKINEHKNKFEPQILHIALYENDDFVIGYKNSELAIVKIKKDAPKRVFVPYSYKNFKLSSFDPLEVIPENVEEIVFNDNISSLGNIKENGSGLVSHAYGRNLKAIYVVKNNNIFESSGGVIYKKSDKSIIFPLEQTEEIVLKTGTIFGKNVIVDLKKLKKLIFPPTASKIGNFAVENCPELTEVIIPKGCKYEQNSFFKCNKNLKIKEI